MHETWWLESDRRALRSRLATGRPRKEAPQATRAIDTDTSCNGKVAAIKTIGLINGFL
jgi:hypothetical protein